MESDVKYENDGSILSTVNSNSQVWLVKVPDFVYEHFSNKPKDTVLGKIVLTKDLGTDKTEVTSCVLENCEGIPSEFLVHEFSLGQQHFVFSEDKDEETLEFEGKANLKLGLSVKNEQDVHYRQIIHQRSMKANERTRFVESINSVDRNKNEKYRPPEVYQSKPINVERKTSSMGDKRERMDKEKLRNLLFVAFKERETYTFKEINFKVDQPDKWLKEVLSEIADTKRDERNKQVWFIKEEYKTNFDNKMDLQ